VVTTALVIEEAKARLHATIVDVLEFDHDMEAQQAERSATVEMEATQNR
jgi:hypothetical protein